MSHIVEYIIKINSLNYNKQYKYIKNKLLSLKSCDISPTIFFKKLQVILYRLPGYLVEFKDEIDEKKYRWYKFWDELHGNSYFDDNDRGIMGLETIKLTNNIYQISIPVNNTPIPVISYIKIN